MSLRLIHNAHIVDSDKDYPRGWLITDGPFIADIGEGDYEGPRDGFNEIFDAGASVLMPGVIDEHVHFREPGLTHKADIRSESAAAAAGGVTTFFDMPNTMPATVSLQAWQEKMELAREKSLVNYAFFVGANPSNLDFIARADYSRIPGIKLFMGTTTGSRGTADDTFLETLFAMAPAIIAVHAEDEETIRRNQREKTMTDPDPAVNLHTDIRSAEACYTATAKIASLARRYNRRAHVLHVSTAREMEFFSQGDIEGKLLTCETCPQYLLFSRDDYATRGARIKCNPSIKDAADREALIHGLLTRRIDTIGTDHAPHLVSEKSGGAIKAASGMPGVQFALPLMLELAWKQGMGYSAVSRLMAGNPARLWNIDRRGFLRKGYYADLTLVAPTDHYPITDASVLSRCAWTPYKNLKVSHTVLNTWVNGKEVYNAIEGVRHNSGAAREARFGNQ